MARYMRKTAILFALETVYGDDAVPTGGANALLVSNVNINPLNAQNVPRDILKPYFGASEELVGTAYKEVSFDVELQGSGTKGTAPAWGPLLRAAGFAELVTAAERVEYNPVTDGMESGSLYAYADGVLHKLLGARGMVKLKKVVGSIPTLSFTFYGLDGGETAAANPAITLSNWKVPRVVTNANTLPIVIGGVYAAGAVSGGTEYTSQGLESDVGNDLKHTPLLGDESVDITDRSATGSLSLDLTPAQEVAFMADVRATGKKSLWLSHGVADGLRVGIFAPAVQFTTPSYGDVNGRRLCKFNVRLTPVAGNDELIIVAQ